MSTPPSPSGDGEPGLGPEERLVLDADLVDARHRHVGRRVGVAVADDHVPDDVRAGIVAVAVPHRRAVGVERLLLGRPLGIDDELERLVLDPDLLGGPAGLLRVLGGDERDRLAEVADAVDREHRLVGELEAVELRAGDVVVGENRVDARHRQRLGDVDRDDARVRVRAAQGVAPEHPRRPEVARVGELPRRLRGAVRARDALADAPDLEPPGGGGAHPRAAIRTASKIFW